MVPINEEIRSQLSLNEKILWSGQPKQGLTLRRSDLFAIPFSLCWCGFAIFWELAVLETDDSVFFKLWGIPFVLIGLYMVAGRFFYDAKQRSHSFYLVTSQRIIIASGICSRHVRSLDLRKLSTLALEEAKGKEKDKEGSLSFGMSSSFPSVFAALFPLPGLEERKAPRFELIKNAKQVYETIVAAQHSGS
jgi:hypothetical protein